MDAWGCKVSYRIFFVQKGGGGGGVGAPKFDVDMKSMNGKL